MMRMLMVPVLAFAAACAPAGHSSGSISPDGRDGDPEQLRGVGVVEFHRDPVTIEVPSEVQRGQEFRVGIRTYGSGCTEKGETRVAHHGTAVDITPYDHTDSDRPCTMQLRTFAHTATVRFDDPGTARIRIRGRSLPADTLLTVERTVHVR